jgi:tetratricopeptide (TPR) repeat protein
MGYEGLESKFKEIFPTCPICGSDLGYDATRKFLTYYVKCRSCGAVWQLFGTLKGEIGRLLLVEPDKDMRASSLVRKSDRWHSGYGYKVEFWKSLDLARAKTEVKPELPPEKEMPQAQPPAGEVPKEAFKVKGPPFRSLFLKGILPILIIGVIIGVYVFMIPPTQSHVDKGITLYNAGAYEQAIAEFTKAIELDPNLAIAYYNRGLAYLKLEQYNQSLADFNKTIELKPDMGEAWSAKGVVLEKLGNYEGALDAYNKALQINPNDQIAKNNKRRLPIVYTGWFGLETTTTETQHDIKITRTAKGTTYTVGTGTPFELKLYSVPTRTEPIYVGMTQITLAYEGDWSVTATPTLGGEYTYKVEVSPSSGHVSGEVKVVIIGVWKYGELGLVIGPAEVPPESLICFTVKRFSYRPDGTLSWSTTSDQCLVHPFYDIVTSLLDASFDSSPYVTEGKFPTIPTSIEGISKMELDEYLSLSGFKWTKIRFEAVGPMEAWFSGAPPILNPPRNKDSKSEYKGVVWLHSIFIP